MRRKADKSFARWRSVVAAASVLLSLAACSTDSPTAPEQEPGPRPGPGPNVWNISVTVTPRNLTVNDTQPAIVEVTVRRAGTGELPPIGTTIVVSASLGEFDTLGSALQSVVLALAGGRAQVLYFPGAVVGSGLITARLEGSIGSRSVNIGGAIEAVVADFTFLNSDENVSVQFQNLSTGDPTRFRWEFGDGQVSTEENPLHVYPAPGDYLVVLTASKSGSSDTVSKFVTIPEPEPPEEIEPVVAGFSFTVSGLTVIFSDASSGEPTSFSWTFGDGTSSTQKNPVHTYAAPGTYVVTLTASKAGSSDSISQFVTVP